MKKHRYVTTKILCVFFLSYFTVAFFYQRDFPVLGVAGEESPGTWMSGALLVICATICLLMTTQQGWWPWSLLFVFFVVLALDERFMFHEQLKANIIFSYGKSTSPFAYELPVIIGACGGVGISFILWKQSNVMSRALLVSGGMLGLLSVVLDVLNVGVFFEECFKLLAELFIVCVLLRKVEALEVDKGTGN